MTLTKITPEQAGLASSHILDFLQAADQEGLELHSFQFLRRGSIYAQGWYAPYTQDDPHILFSFTKSFTSTAIGFAWQEGKIALTDRLVDIFPDKLPENPSENLQLCTVQDLLTMSCGHQDEVACDPFAPSDFVQDFLAHPFVYKPGTHFLYNTAGTNMLVEVLRRKAGANLIAYLTPRLFVPLGITNMQCYPLQNGTEMGGGGGLVCTQGMSLFTQFVANDGVWQGKQLLKKEWFDMATSKQIDNYPNWGANWEVGYGFQFWMCTPKNTFRGDGAFGQYGVVCRDEEAVFVLTSASTNMARILDLLFLHIKPHFAATALPENPAAQQALEWHCQNLQLRCPLSRRRSGKTIENGIYKTASPIPTWMRLIGGAGAFHCSSPDFTRLQVDFTNTAIHLTALSEDGSAICLPVGFTSSYNRFLLEDIPYAAVGTWVTHNELRVEARCLHAATGAEFSLLFEGDTLTLKTRSSFPEDNGMTNAETRTQIFIK